MKIKIVFDIDEEDRRAMAWNAGLEKPMVDYDEAADIFKTKVYWWLDDVLEMYRRSKTARQVKKKKAARQRAVDKQREGDIKTKWREIRTDQWHLVTLAGGLIIAVVGTIRRGQNRVWVWEARVMWEATKEKDGEPIRGEATSLKQAKEIVERTCRETGTI